MRPYTICHVLSSIDGNISGEFFKSPLIKPVIEAFNKIRDDYNCQGFIYGATTVAGTYADKIGDRVENTLRISQDLFNHDYVTDNRYDQYFFVVNPDGYSFWENEFLNKRGFKDAKIVELVTEKTQNLHLLSLRGNNNSYLICGEDKFSPEIALEKISKYYNLDRVMICGGGILDWTFLEDGLIDELSIVIAPLTDGDTSRASVFDRSRFSRVDKTFAFDLKDVQKVDGGGVWIRYLSKNA